MSVKPPTTVEVWTVSSDPGLRVFARVEAQRDHVKVSLSDLGYDEGSKLGLDHGDNPAKMQRLAAFYRDLAETIDVACVSAGRER